MVYLTGAGCGDKELLTIKALKVIQKADVIIYDRLIDEEILDFAPKNCKKVFVGKECKTKCISQDEINEIIYKFAKEFENVVRLKGGDPFVFARGAEEAIYLRQRNICFEIIPGISSFLASSSYAAIPLTYRGLNSSFRIVAANLKGDIDLDDVQYKSFLYDESIVFLMGFHKFELLCKRLLAVGKDRFTPCAVVSKAASKEQEVVVGTLDDIYEKSKHLSSPCTIFLGNVVAKREEIMGF